MAKPNKTIEEHTCDVIQELERLKEYNYIQDENIYKLCKLACQYHDLGKKNHKFQERVVAEKRIPFNPEKEVPHNILSGYMIDEKDFEDTKDYLIVLYAVLYHHNYVEVMRYIQEETTLIEKTLEEMGVETKIGIRTRRRLNQIIEGNESIRVKGLLHKCDYSASSGNVCEYEANFLLEGLQRFLTQLRKKDDSACWNKMQQYCIESRDDNIIVVAQTGMGKTEGALNWIGNHKGFFVLPLRTAINAMYERIKVDMLNKEDISKRLSILHSNSLAYYVQQAKTLEEEEEVLDYEARGKQWAIPLSVTTMDQLFDFIFKYQGYELKLSTLGYSKIVIDEIQMYSPDLLAYLVYGLERIYELGGKIAIITATLPPFIEDLLYNRIPFKSKQVYCNDDSIRHCINVKEKAIDVEDICEQFRSNQNLDKSNKILVICNTIGKARDIYSQLIDRLGDECVKLLHSRFVRQDRKVLEEEIKAFGQTYGSNGQIDKREGIWVSTSLVEASLDIDFDYLFTELQDLSSLFQRMGRCNRKGKKDVTGANCIIYTEIDEKLIIRGDKGFIDGKIYELSKNALQRLNGPLKESEKMALIQQALTTSNLKDSEYMKQYKEAYELIENIRPYKYDKVDIRLRNIFTEEIIPSPIYEKYRQEINELIAELQQNKVAKYTKVKLEEQLMDYTVAIPQYEIRKYMAATLKKQAQIWTALKFGYNRQIRIVDCEYDKRGFVTKDYTPQSGEGEFL